MMDDPKANYYETLKAFRVYWKDRVLPKEPFETEGAESFEREVGLITDKASEEKREREEKKRAKHNKSQLWIIPRKSVLLRAGYKVLSHG